MKAFGKVRPGDDFLLRFGVVESGDITVEVYECDFLACYDKKLLWRANLYIDERKNEDGSWKAGDPPQEGVQEYLDWIEACSQDDWNDLHPWDDPEENAWYVSMDDGAFIDGGQIEINSWTRFSDDINVSDSVAYTHAGFDSVKDFNYCLEEQQKAIAAWYTAYPNPEYSNWDKTTAPDNKWGYLNRNPDENNNTVNYRFGIPTGDSHGSSNPLTINNVTYYPYTPGYSAKRVYRTNNYRAVHIYYSAGVDCTTFIMKAASYPGEPYKVQNLRDRKGISDWKLKYEGGFISETPGLVKDKSVEITEDKRSLLVPGDIVICDGHAGIIFKIEFSGNTRAVSNDDIKIIESTGRDWKVKNDFSFQDWLSDSGDFPNPTTRRLMEK